MFQIALLLMKRHNKTETPIFLFVMYSLLPKVIFFMFVLKPVHFCHLSRKEVTSENIYIRYMNPLLERGNPYRKNGILEGCGDFFLQKYMQSSLRRESLTGTLWSQFYFLHE